jgi:hypothetical protein
MMMMMRKDVGADRMVSTSRREEKEGEKIYIYILCVLSLACKVRSEETFFQCIIV